MNLSSIPGYDRALKRAGRLEDSWREFPFLGVTHRICGIHIEPLTLRAFVQLCSARSPFFVGGPVRPEHIVQFLWRLSPQYEMETARPRAITRRGRRVSKRQKFIASVIALPYHKVRRAIDRFIDRNLIDKPPVTDGPSSQPDVSFVASFVHELASAYGWSEDTILDLPMPAIFQYFREIRRDKYAAAGKSCPRFNPLRSRLTKRILEKAMKANCRASVSDARPGVSQKRPTKRKKKCASQPK